MQEVKDRPQIAQAVLDRRASQGQPMWGDKLEDCTRLSGLWILDVLRLINYDSVPLQVPQELFVQPRQCEGGQGNIVRLAPRFEGFLVFDSCAALVHQGT